MGGWGSLNFNLIPSAEELLKKMPVNQLQD